MKTKPSASPRRKIHNSCHWSTDTARALQVPTPWREALLLVAVGGFSYIDTAKICKLHIGTVKSRVARGRAARSGDLDGPQNVPGRAK